MNGGAFDRFGSLSISVDGAGADHQRDVRQIADANVLIDHFVVDHGCERGAFADGVAGQFGVIIAAARP